MMEPYCDNQNTNFNFQHFLRMMKILQTVICQKKGFALMIYQRWGRNKLAYLTLAKTSFLPVKPRYIRKHGAKVEMFLSQRR
jgi:hypothetical protein